MTNKINLKDVERKLQELNHNEELITKGLKRVQTEKCRWKKMKGHVDYEQRMIEILSEEQILKEARNLLNPKEKPVTQYTKADIDQLDYDETVKAIRSIQSKKSIVQWKTAVQGDSDEYRDCIRIELLLLDHKKEVKPHDDIYILKTDVQTIIDTMESVNEVSREMIIDLLKSLM
jgi:hypothetical protein